MRRLEEPALTPFGLSSCRRPGDRSRAQRGPGAGLYGASGDWRAARSQALGTTVGLAMGGFRSTYRLKGLYLLNRDFTAPAPNRVWVADFTACRTRGGCVYVVFVVDVFARPIIAWHAATDKRTELVLAPVRMATWERERTGHRVVGGQLVHHNDASRGEPVPRYARTWNGSSTLGFLPAGRYA